jgi:hypothetical protein
MSVPLDRLYNFLDDNVDQDIVIYRWWPHGSKNLSDLSRLKSYQEPLYDLTNPIVIFHDQETIHLDNYTNDIVIDQIIKNKNWLHYTDYQQSAELIKKFKLHDNFFRELTCNLNVYDKYILVHSEINSCDLEHFKNNGAIPVYYWTHALIARDWFRFAEYKTDIRSSFNSKKDFLIYNRAWSGSREYRIKFAELIIENNLIHQSQTKFSTVDNNVHYKNHIFKNTKFKINPNLNLENFFPFNDSPAESSADFNENDYQNCLVEIVLETLFDTNKIHLTEKALRPIACKMPFILLSSPGSLEYLKNYGFKTFDNIIDESYDKITDPLERLHAVIKVMKTISSMSKSDKINFFQKSQPICEYNHQLFFSKNFTQRIIAEFKENFNSAMSQIKNTKLGNLFKQRLNVTYALDKHFSETTPEIRIKPWLTQEQLLYLTSLVDS